ncbi:MAG: RNA-directed DNA polymerase [bacterium]|nr:RNA-directed DNA polymerase [bacterium]
MAKNWRARPDGFGDGRKRSIALRHSLARSGLLRRQLDVVNPIAYAGLSAEVAEQWRDLYSAIRQSSYSSSRPVFHRSGARAFLPAVANQGDLVPRRAQIRGRARVLVSTDISRFYHSIYTHSVPWALHGKGLAKRNRRYTLPGNRLDRALRNCRDQQTVGISIGPDTSLVLAELVLSQVDVALKARVPTVRVVRYIDDYELAVDSHDEAEHVVGVLQEVLSHFELELNPRKTDVQALPVPHEYRWVSDLRSLPLQSGKPGQANNLVRLFDRAFEFSGSAPGQPVLRYLMGRIQGIDVHPYDWGLYQDLLLQCMTVEPGTIAAALGLLIEQVRSGLVVNKRALEAALNRSIQLHAPLGHHNEVAWAVWGIMVLEMQLLDATISVLEKMEDPVVALLCLHAERAGYCATSVDKTLWQRHMTRRALYESQWLLAYEALVKGWLPSADGTNYVKADSYFAFLDQLGVRFYRERAIKRVQATGVPPTFGIAPVFYA